jgi:hypothetical protein
MTDTAIHPNAFRAATAVFVGYAAVMLEVDRRLHQTGGPGIVPFELAGTEARASDMMARWGTRGRRLARVSLWLDFGYMLTYGGLIALLVERARRRHGHPLAVSLTVAGTVAGDAIEGVSLLKVLDGTQIGAHARRARSAALVKFALLAVCLVYAAVGNARQPRAY